MKKLLGLVLTIVLTTSLFAGCGQEETAPAESAEQAVTSGTAETSETQGEWQPEKDITFVVPFDAGGTADVPARIMVKYMNKYSDVDFNVVNMPGSGGRIGAKHVMDSEADGYTLVHVPTGWYMQKALGIADFSYEDFEPITLWAQSWLSLVVKGDSEYQTLEDLLADAKANPDTIKMGGVAGTLPVLGELTIEQRADVDFNMVNIDLQGKAAELLSGRIDTYVDGFGTLKPYIDSGDFRCLGVFSDTTPPGYDDLPLMKDHGVEDVSFLNQVFGLWAPKGTPDNVLDYVNEVIEKAANDPECQAEMEKVAFAPIHTPREEYVEILKKSQADTNEAVKPILESAN